MNPYTALAPGGNCTAGHYCSGGTKTAKPVSDADEAGAGGQRSSGTVHGVDEGRSRTGDVGMQDAEGGDEEAEGLGDGTDAVTDAAIQSAMQTAREAGIDFDDLVDADL